MQRSHSLIAPRRIRSCESSRSIMLAKCACRAGAVEDAMKTMSWLVPAMLVMATTIAFWAAAGSTRPAVVATSVATLGLLVLDLTDVIPGTGAPAIAFGLSAALILIGVGSLVDGEGQLRARLTGLIDDLDAVLWTKDPTSYSISYVNGRARELLGLGPEEWRADGFWLARVHPDDRLQVLEDTIDAVDARRDHEITYGMVHADGSIVHVLDRVTVVLDSGRVTGAEALIRLVDRDVPVSPGAFIGVAERAGLENNRFADDLRKISESTNVIECHQEEVWEMPVGAEVIVCSDKASVEMFCFGDHILGIQGHTEYTKDILYNLIDRLFTNGSINMDFAEEAKAKMEATET